MCYGQGTKLGFLNIAARSGIAIRKAESVYYVYRRSRSSYNITVESDIQSIARAASKNDPEVPLRILRAVKTRRTVLSSGNRLWSEQLFQSESPSMLPRKQ